MVANQGFAVRASVSSARVVGELVVDVDRGLVERVRDRFVDVELSVSLVLFLPRVAGPDLALALLPFAGILDCDNEFTLC